MIKKVQDFLMTKGQKWTKSGRPKLVSYSSNSKNSAAKEPTSKEVPN
jgi:hypothetical protein